MTTFATRDLEGWGRFPVQSCQTARAEKRRDLAEAAASGDVPSILARGLGRSYGDAALNENSGVVLTAKLGRFLDFNPQTGVLHAEAGASFADILETFVPRGYFLPVTPGTRFVTLGGAIACDVHGKNHHVDGCLAEFVEELELLTASGEVLNCSRQENADIFWATVAGMGLTGIVLTAKLRLIPIETAYIASSFTRTGGLDETLAGFEADAKVKYSVAWVDCLATGASLGRSVIIRGEHASHDELPVGAEALGYAPAGAKPLPVEFPDFALNGLSVKAFNALYYATHPTSHKVVPFAPFFWPLDAVSGWNKIYGPRGFIQYQCVLPFGTSRAGLVKLLEKISGAGRASFLAVLKVAGAENPSLLGFMKPGHTLALDLPAAPGIVEFARELDAIVLDHGGRCYLAKDSTLEPANLRQMYPRLPQFEALKARIDPENRFQSSLSRRLHIGGAA